MKTYFFCDKISKLPKFRRNFVQKSFVKKQAFDYELIATAYHEAGHVIGALCNYLYVCGVSISTSMSPSKKGGIVEYSTVYEYDSISDEELKKEFIICELRAIYAGLSAEKMYYKDICGSSKFPMHLKNGSSYDIELVSSIIRKNKIIEPGKNTFLFKKQIRDAVEELLYEHWDAVKVIAHALYKKKRLTFEELNFLLTRKTENRSFWKDKFKKIKLLHSEKTLSEEYVKEILFE